MNNKLRDERRRRGWRVEWIIEKLHVGDAETYRRWERGRSKPTMSNLLKLCDLFDMKPEELGFGVDENPLERSDCRAEDTPMIREFPNGKEQ